MSRTKHTMKAPDGVEESLIEGTYYFPDFDNGTVETTNENHVKILAQHGYTLVGSVSITRPAALNRGPIDTDELGRAALAAALAERGLSYPEDATRAELAEIAGQWNHANNRRSRGAPVRAEVRPALAPVTADDLDDDEDDKPARAFEPAAVAPPTEPAVDPAIEKLSLQELRGWLAAHGVVLAIRNPTKAECLKAYRDYQAAKVTA